MWFFTTQLNCVVKDKLPMWIKLIDWNSLTGNETRNRGIGEKSPVKIWRVLIGKRVSKHDPARIPGGPRKSILGEFLF